MMYLINVLASEHCFGCVFKLNNTSQNVIIQLTQLCVSTSPKQVQVLYKNQQFFSEAFSSSVMVIETQYKTNLTVVVSQDGKQYIFYKRPSSKNPSTIKVIIASSSIVVLVVAAYVALKINKKCKNKRKPAVALHNTPTHSTEIATMIL
ncbi:Hypothetical_protein [Hexamita inflata]|uniref:Hypothetical_protein n=1 Tax=Hexamita inflata TaxID=28002 RepID=A0AA86PQN6_9EUKA|nr:Hypothetical protein HINF_LOCUS26934 [Hexamita inflata]